MQNAIAKAIKLAKSQSGLARVLGISPQALSKQIRKGRILPEHCIVIERQYLGEITRYELDPDHFGPGDPASDCVVIVLQNFKNTSTTV